MIRPIRIMIGKPDKHAYYYAAYAATAKLSLGSVQMDKMVLDHIYIDISTTFKEAVSCIELMQSTIDNVQSQDDQSAQALLAFCKSADSFRQSSKRFYEFVLDKAIHNVTVSANDPFRTPPRAGEMVTPSDFGTWNAVIPQLNKMLQSFSDCISSGIRMIKTKFADFKQKFQMDAIMTTFVDIMILLARIQFKVKDESTYYKALEYLHKAEDLCVIMKYNAGYSWISGSYYSMGTAMIKVDMYSKAIYPIRKSCTLLEKSIECDSSDESKLELSTRYEILGTCCFKNKDYEDAGKAYRLGLRQIPTSKIKNFVDQGNSIAVSTIMENDRLIPKLMDRFLRTSIIDPKQESVTFASEHLDLSNFNLIQQSIIYECELKVWSILSLKTKLNRFQLFIAEKLLEVYEPTSYPLRRARYTSHTGLYMIKDIDLLLHFKNFIGTRQNREIKQ
ncbi:hypothetical protein RO3G_00375 [Rhizopus delemar RA 99-880]|uniref:Trafficking protein particle complex subunit 11 domain-containing protein n=1 Tax=Rhizopus delemar (strain RA 99-880 / ATCC MYA-4621 / FGSC 9543 / NRRL 43880) TaxID=246409 RepID=I1BHJ1_RHIO9|nr:hypothetical protein RO3G_00375 [Rhizopus delemar RA 99-880]|eukprot:EIE75671.1 hypothetical protein RO3G_00375 [Rhizopus delemar RA 99-880]